MAKWTNQWTQVAEYIHSSTLKTNEHMFTQALITVHHTLCVCDICTHCEQQLTNSCRTILLVMRVTSGAVCFCLGFDGGMGGAGCCGWGCFSPFLLTACSKVDIFSFRDSASWVIALREASSRHHLLHLAKHNLSCCLLW